jgi:hypothetical protein
MYTIRMTFDTSQDPMSWLKTDASQNMRDLFATLDTSEDPMSWSKTDATSHIPFMSATLNTFPQSNGLDKNRCALKYLLHVCHTGDIPILVHNRCTIHCMSVDAGHIPGSNVLVEWW